MGTTILSAQSLYTTFLDQPPSCLEFCPAAPDYLVIGTYLLSESSPENSTGTQQSKTGTIQLFKLDSESFQLTQIHKISLPHAVFDLHFSPRDPTLFAVATNAASVCLYRLEASHANGRSSSLSSFTSITLLTSIPVHDDTSISALYFSWLPPPTLTTGSRGSLDHDYHNGQLSTDGFAVSFSDGRVSVFHTNSPSHEISKESMTEIALPGEPVEVWFTTFHYGNSLSGGKQLMLLSGDDFGGLRVHQFAGDGEGEGEGEGNVEGKEHGGEQGGVVWTDGQFPVQTVEARVGSRHHGAGITAILPLFTEGGETVLLTGSYDEYLRVYKLTGRGSVLASVLAEERLGGGVWRLKVVTKLEEEPLGMEAFSNMRRERSYLVLASCMHAGVRIVKVTCSTVAQEGDGLGMGRWDIKVLAQFTEHESMNYASDVWRGSDMGGGDNQTEEERVCSLLCVSSSFYDKKICVWKAKV
ncbi:hypothetical protein ACJ72_02265 [Emergomyces africanus]|uniref:Diphthine methyltransferase n=1 Tax=Emergomyces africanus TaxID=1955775 RepID=A0A1B7P2X6_9EURO|nr:hypothetical protein ACJ72_02265 [Emergomyces africanus]